MFYYLRIGRRFWKKPEIDSDAEEESVSVDAEAEKHPLDGILYVPTFKSLKIRAQFANRTGCLEVLISQPFAKSERKLGDHLAVCTHTTPSSYLTHSFSVTVYNCIELYYARRKFM